MLTFFLHPPRNFFKKQHLGMDLGEAIQSMTFRKPVVEGLKWMECKHSIEGRNSHAPYIPKQDTVQDALKK